MNQEIDIIKKWLEEVIIGLNICPFAREPYLKNQINFVFSEVKDIEETVEAELKNLANDEFQTSLIITQGSILYYELVDLVDFLNGTLNTNNTYQFIVFHPEFHFGDTPMNSRANLVNRSPYPLIHILKNSELDNLLNTEQAKMLSFQNEKSLNRLTNKELEKYFNYLNIEQFKL